MQFKVLFARPVRGLNLIVASKSLPTEVNNSADHAAHLSAEAKEKLRTMDLVCTETLFSFSFQKSNGTVLFSYVR